MAQASSVFFGSQELGRDCSFLKPLASTPASKTLPIGEELIQFISRFSFVLLADYLVTLALF